MSLSCIARARHFEPSAHRPFVMSAEQVGWIRESDVPLLAQWPDVFEIDAAGVTLAARFDVDANRRSAALATVIGALAGQGRIHGWRDETYAIRNTFDGEPLDSLPREEDSRRDRLWRCTRCGSRLDRRARRVRYRRQGSGWPPRQEDRRRPH